MVKPTDPGWAGAYDVTWTSPSKNASESMPVGGHDIGLNVWVENGDILFYIDRSGSFDENNQMDKLGRVRLTLAPNPFRDPAEFRQTLRLETGAVTITATGDGVAATVTVRVETGRPVIHADVASAQPVTLHATYENWRTAPHALSTAERMSPYSFAGTRQEKIPLFTHADTFAPGQGEMVWYHRNDPTDLAFDKELIFQHLEQYADRLWNPQKDFTFGGLMRSHGSGGPTVAEVTYQNTTARAWRFTSDGPGREHAVTIFLHAGQTETVEAWKKGLRELADAAEPTRAQAWEANVRYWTEFWGRSHIVLMPRSPEDPLWKIGRNYQLFRYQLGCNAAGEYPTKFNGGLFTFDPVFVKAENPFPPDFRRWGGGSFTAQNQRLVYWPMLKAGDFDLMLPQFEFYLRALPNAELRTRVYWNHGGASFTEQLENFGLPAGDIYETAWGDRPVGPRPGDDHGSLVNTWCEHLHDTVIEFALMMLDYQQFTGKDITKYLPLAESVVEFFDQHYRYQHKLRAGRELDAQGRLVIFPGSACETYKLATNATPTVAGLRTLLTRMLALPDSYGDAARRARWREILERVPPLTFCEQEGRKMISPAKSWMRISNCEAPQMYPVFPYGMFGVGKPQLQVAIDTYDFGIDGGDEHKGIEGWQNTRKGIHGWRQDPIWMARMGLTQRAAEMVAQKLADAPLRFPTFWGPTFDWTPDFNHGGSAMIALQEMLMQTDDRVIRLLPAWPKGWDVRFKLRAPYQTTVEGRVEKGRLADWTVAPAQRAGDVIVADEWK